jgi:hypothetical protein
VRPSRLIRSAIVLRGIEAWLGVITELRREGTAMLLIFQSARVLANYRVERTDLPLAWGRNEPRCSPT